MKRHAQRDALTYTNQRAAYSTRESSRPIRARGMSLDDVVDFCATNCPLGSPLREFKYADNCNSAKIYCAIPIIGATEKIAQPLSTQYKLSKEHLILEIRPVLPEINIFCCMHSLTSPRGNLIRQKIAILRKFISLVLLSAQQKKIT